MEFCVKLEFDTIYYAYLYESPFKYYISILGWGWGVQNSGKPAYIILARSLNGHGGNSADVILEHFTTDTSLRL